MSRDLEKPEDRESIGDREREAGGTSMITSAGNPSSDDPVDGLPGFAWTLILGVGLAAGLASFAVGEAAPSWVPPSFEFSKEILADRNRIPSETQRRVNRSQDLAAAIAYGSLGLLLGFGLGVTGGLARGVSGRPFSGALFGIILGGVAGSGASMLLLPIFHAARSASTDENVNLDLALALVTHGGIWMAVGAAAGAAMGIGMGVGGRIPRAVVGGLLGAGLAALTYEVVGAVALPLAQTFRPRAATMPARLMAHLLVAVLTSVLALWALRNLRLGKTTVAAATDREPALQSDAGARS